MQNIDWDLILPISLILAWIIIALREEQRKKLVDNVQKAFEIPVELVDDHVDDPRKKKDFIRSPIKKTPDWTVTTSIQEIIKVLIQSLTRFVTTLSEFLNRIIEQVFDDPSVRAWRISGALIYLVFVLAFVYADITQSYNNISIIEPAITVPEFFREISISLVVTSVGTMAALGVFLADMAGVTKFYPWEDRPKVFKIVTFASTLITLLIALILLFLPPYFRYVQFSDLPVEIIAYANNLASFSLSAIVLPLLLTTLLMATYGIVGFIVIFVFIVTVFIFFLKCITVFLRVLSRLVNLGLLGIAILIAAFLAIYVGFLFLVKGLVLLTLQLIAPLFAIIQSILDFVSYPVQITVDKIQQYSQNRDEEEDENGADNE